MKTLGIDLASDPARTGVALVAWRDGAAHVEHIAVGADDDELCARHATADATGIDAPFGWPLPFVDFVAQHGRPPAPTPETPWSPERVRALRYRQTDRAARAITGRWPLSPSSDLVAVPTFRCLGLLARLGVTDRGRGPIYETYPALALKRWGLADTGYKGRARRDRLAALADALCACAPWLSLDPAAAALVRQVDDAFDALVAALIARAAHLGRVTLPTPAERAAATHEGWIVIPDPDALEDMASRDAIDGI